MFSRPGPDRSDPYPTGSSDGSLGLSRTNRLLSLGLEAAGKPFEAAKALAKPGVNIADDKGPERAAGGPKRPGAWLATQRISSCSTPPRG